MKVILARDVEAAEANAIAIYDKVTEFIENFLHESEKDGETSTADAPARARRAPTKKAAATPKATKTAKKPRAKRTVRSKQPVAATCTGFVPPRRVSAERGPNSLLRIRSSDRLSAH